MWKRFKDSLRCVICGGELDAAAYEEGEKEPSKEHISTADSLNIKVKDLRGFIENGILICPGCKTIYPIFKNLPILLPYKTGLHDEFSEIFGAELKKMGDGYKFANAKPALGEEYVLRSFSKEWLDYSYDDVLWTWTYEEREKIFLAEIGFDKLKKSPKSFLEIGCGIGIVTSFAQKNLGGEAVGVDLSLAGICAANHFNANPFLHFVEASLWSLPFDKEAFDVVYSHGVIHHTKSTKDAFFEISKRCKKNGLTYIWIYGKGSIDENIIRKGAYLLEVVLRPFLARSGSVVNTAVLYPLAFIYMLVNFGQRLTGLKRQRYNFSRALHAARDRFTPLFAHRADYDETISWFIEKGFEEIERIDLGLLPESSVDTFRRNVGVRGIKRLQEKA